VGIAGLRGFILSSEKFPALLNLRECFTSYDTIYLLTAIGLTPGGSSTVNIYTQTVHSTT
jgi:hypothetical protein